jgi:hypothetical protein
VRVREEDRLARPQEEQKDWRNNERRGSSNVRRGRGNERRGRSNERQERLWGPGEEQGEPERRGRERGHDLRRRPDNMGDEHGDEGGYSSRACCSGNERRMSGQQVSPTLLCASGCVAPGGRGRERCYHCTWEYAEIALWSPPPTRASDPTLIHTHPVLGHRGTSSGDTLEHAS